jgi:hypothetical protein
MSLITAGSRATTLQMRIGLPSVAAVATGAEQQRGHAHLLA